MSRWLTGWVLRCADPLGLEVATVVEGVEIPNRRCSEILRLWLWMLLRWDGLRSHCMAHVLIFFFFFNLLRGGGEEVYDMIPLRASYLFVRFYLIYLISPELR